MVKFGPIHPFVDRADK